MTYYFPYLFIIVITLLITIIVFLIINYKHTKSKSDKNNTIHNRYLDIFKKADVGLQIFNKEGYLIEYNETAKDMWGICDESKKEFNLFFYPVIKDIFNTESEKYKEHIFNFEYDFDKENIFKSTRGGKISAICKIRLMYDSNGCFSFFLVTTNDVSEEIEKSRKYEHILNERNTIFQSIPSALSIYDVQGKLTFINNSYIKLAGITDVNKFLKSGTTMFSPFFNEEIIGKMRQNIDFDFDFTLNFDDPSISKRYFSNHSGQRYFVSKFRLIRDMKGDISNYIILTKDITEEHEQNKLLQESANNAISYNQTLNAIINNIPCMLFVKDISDDYRYVISNILVSEYMGKDTENIVGYTDFNILEKEEAERFRKDDIKAVEMNGLYTFREEVNWKGKKSYLNTTKFPIELKDGKKLLICISVDVTYLNEINKDLKSAKEKAENADKLKSAFLANMSHEIRTPLNSIVGFSSIIAETEDKKEKEEYLTIIKHCSDQLLHLINSILDISKIESGYFDINPADFDITDLFRKIESSFKVQMNKGVNLVCIIPDESFNVKLDKNRLLEIMNNFISNSIKHTERGEIIFGYRHENDGIKCYVTDTGSGISEDGIKKLFNRFEKLNSTKNGAGLGLAITKALVEKAGGKVGVESKQGEGSTFWIWLPLSD